MYTGWRLFTFFQQIKLRVIPENLINHISHLLAMVVAFPYVLLMCGIHRLTTLFFFSKTVSTFENKINKLHLSDYCCNWLLHHFYRASAHWRAILIKQFCPSVCLSVRPSIRQWCSGIRWKRLSILSQFFSAYRSPIILVLSASNNFTKFRRRHPLHGR